MTKVQEIRAGLTNNPERINNELLVQALEELEENYLKKVQTEILDLRLKALERLSLKPGEGER